MMLDAICINQKDTYERNAQVHRMRRIYQKANQVVVWLGPALNRGDIAVRFLKLVFDNCPRGGEIAWFKNLMKDNDLAMEWKAMAGFFGTILVEQDLGGSRSRACQRSACSLRNSVVDLDAVGLFSPLYFQAFR